MKLLKILKSVIQMINKEKLQRTNRERKYNQNCRIEKKCVMLISIELINKHV